jgi:hypothetical protein
MYSDHIATAHKNAVKRANSLCSSFLCRFKWNAVNLRNMNEYLFVGSGVFKQIA